MFIICLLTEPNNQIYLKMKNIPIVLALLFSLLFFNCGDDNNDIVNNEDDDITNDDANGDDEIVNISSCDFNLSSITSGETIGIDCLLDLDGETIALPSNVTFTYEKGDIINGTLNFIGDSKIDGRLLNSSLNVNGDISLIDKTFTFIPSRWTNIIEGVATYEKALSNTKTFENLMFSIRAMGGEIFEIDKFDAYFEVSTVTSTTSDQNFRPTKEAVNLPSNFHLKMTNNTFLRMFTTASGGPNATLMAVRDVDNVKISGGNFIGDRLTRNYDGENSGEIGSRLFSIHASRLIEVDNVNFEYGSGGGITIFSLGFPFNTDYIPTDGVLIKNSTFKNIRRMSTSVTDGKNIIIEGNTYINTGQPIASDDGGNVGYAVNLETFRRRDENGDLLEFQRLSDVTIKDNQEINSKIGFLLVLGSSNVTVENNTAETRMAINFSNGVSIFKNNFKGTAEEKQNFAIFAAGENSEFTFDNEIYDNTISGNYGTGISVLSQKCKIYDNSIDNSEVGIQLISSSEIEIRKNSIKANNIGILSNLTFIDKVDIIDNTIEGKNAHVKFTQVNKDIEHVDFRVNLNKNKFTSEAGFTLSGVNGINVNENEIVGGVTIKDASNINVVSNSISPINSDGIWLDGTHTNVEVSKNTIYEPTGADRFECISNDSTTPNGILISDNSCDIK